MRSMSGLYKQLTSFCDQAGSTDLQNIGSAVAEATTQHTLSTEGLSTTLALTEQG